MDMLLNKIIFTKNKNEKIGCEFDDNIKDIDEEIDIKLDELSNNTAYLDKEDYVVASSIGMLTGVINSILNGESLIKIVRNEGGNILSEIFKLNTKDIKKIEEQFKNPADRCANEFGHGDHHLYEFSHHISPIGLLSSIITQFTGKVYGLDTNTGLLKQCKIENFDFEIKGNNFFEKMVNAVCNYFGHILSDFLGSSESIKKGNEGCGVPGPIMSLLLELNSLGIIRNKEDSKKFSDGMKELFLDKENKMDFRFELGKMTNDALLSITNIIIIKIYFIFKNIVKKVKENKIKNFKDINLKNLKDIIDTNNPTFNRMQLISSAIMSSINIFASAITSHGNDYNFLIRLNYFGIKTTIKCGFNEYKYFLKRNSLNKELINLRHKKTNLLFNKIEFYHHNNQIKLNQLIKMYEENIKLRNRAVEEQCKFLATANEDMDDINDSINKLKESNPKLINKMKDILE